MRYARSVRDPVAALSLSIFPATPPCLPVPPARSPVRAPAPGCRALPRAVPGPAVTATADVDLLAAICALERAIGAIDHHDRRGVGKARRSRAYPLSGASITAMTQGGSVGFTGPPATSAAQSPHSLPSLRPSRPVNLAERPIFLLLPADALPIRPGHPVLERSFRAGL